jgi:hypothetical protein
MGDGDAERNRRPACQVLQIVLDYIPGDAALIDCRRQLRGVVIAPKGPHARQINRRARRQIPERRQVAAIDQLADIGADDHLVERIAQAHAVLSFGGRRDAQNFGFRPGRGNVLPGSGDGVVRFVDHEQRRLG